jgi:hypothetical protein
MHRTRGDLCSHCRQKGPLVAIVGVLAGLTVAFGVVAIPAGVVSRLNSRRIEKVLRRHPWVSWPAQFTFVPSGSDNFVGALFLGADQAQVLGVQGFAWRQKRLIGLSEIWLAGTPEEGGVVSPPGGDFLLKAARPARRYEPRRMAHRPLNDPGSSQNR